MPYFRHGPRLGGNERQTIMMFGPLEFFLILPLLGLGLLLLAFGFWLWMLVDCVTKESSAGNDKVCWLLILLGLNLLGALLYYIVRRPRRNAGAGV